MVFLVQYLFAYCLIRPFQPIFTRQVLYLVAFSCVLTAAAGNIINDYYDRKIDAVNKPEKVYIGTLISPRTALMLYGLLNLVALILGGKADWVQRRFYTTSFVSGSILLLWAYSRYFKKAYLVGNLIVAFLTTAPMLLLTLLEIDDFGIAQQFPILVLYMFFSFATSLIREIIKDCEDVDGDKIGNARTLPLVGGLMKTKNIVCLLISLVVGVLGAVGFLLYRLNYILLLIYVLALVFLLIILYLNIKKAESPRQFHKASSFVKIIMLLGIMSMLFFA